MGTAIASVLSLLFAQITGECLTDSFHDVLRMLVPIGFNTYRLGQLMNWVKCSFLLNNSNFGWWKTTNQALAVINLAFWTYNLFGFLLLRVLPLYFDKEDTPCIEMKYTLFPIPKSRELSKKCT